MFRLQEPSVVWRPRRWGRSTRGDCIGVGPGRMLEVVLGLGDVARHGHVAGASRVVPLQSETTVLGTGPIGRDGIKFAQRCEEVLGMVGADILHAKIIDGETKGHRSSSVREEASCMLDRMVIGGGKVGKEACIGNDAS